MSEKTISKEKLATQGIIEGLLRALFLFVCASAICGGYRYEGEMGFIYKGAGIGVLLISVILACILTIIFKKKTAISLALNGLLAVCGGVLLVFLIGSDPHSFPATQGALSTLVQSVVRPGPTGYSATLPVYIFGVCSAFAYGLNCENSKKKTGFIFGCIMAFILEWVVSFLIEDALFKHYINSGVQEVLVEGSAVANRIIAIVACIGVILMHLVPYVSILKKREEK